MTQQQNYCVYCHINKKNGKRYIGLTKQEVQRRWGNNGSKYLIKRTGTDEYRHPHFARAILKYGWDNFEHEIIAEHLTKEQACQLEKELIEKYKTQNSEFGYNIADGGTILTITESIKEKLKGPRPCMQGENHPGYGKHRSEETKKKISESRKGKYNGKNHPMYGKHHSKETRNKISSSHKGVQAKEKHPRWGVHLSLEEKEKIAQSHLKGKQIWCLENGKFYLTLKEAAEDLKVNKSGVSKCCLNTIKSTGGYHFKLIKKIQEENKKMKLTNIKEVEDFLATIKQCTGDVILKSQWGDVYNLSSTLSSYIAMGALLGEHGEELELFCSNKEDEAKLLKFFKDHPEAL